MATLTGSEKQIEWANKIKATIETMLRKRYAELEAQLSTKQAEKWAKAAPAMQTAIDSLLSETSASIWIDKRFDLENVGWVNTYLMDACRKALA